jgi:glutaminyl-peptide cyclotransferase
VRTAPAWALVLLGVAAASADPAAPFDADRAWRDLEHIVGLGPRPSGSPALGRTRAYLEQELRRAGVRTWTQAFVASTPTGPVSMVNLVAEIPGRTSDVVLLGGHYDTKFYPHVRFVGANDGGSSTAVLLEVARQLAPARREQTIWVVFFDGEEDRNPRSNAAAMHGSRYMVSWLAQRQEVDRIRAVLVIDMVGDRHLDIRRDASSTPWLTDLLWATAQRLGHGRHFLPEAVPIVDDHVPFLEAGIPAALLIDYNYGGLPWGSNFWHTPQDTLDKLAPASLKVVGEVLLGALPAVEARGHR